MRLIVYLKLLSVIQIGYKFYLVQFLFIFAPVFYFEVISSYQLIKYTVFLKNSIRYKIIFDYKSV